MTDQTSHDPDGMHEIDSLVANEFAVEVDGQAATGIFRISGLVSFRLESAQAAERTLSPLRISKMIQRDPYNPFNTWIRDTFAAPAGADRPLRTVTLHAVDNGTPIRRWTLEGAWISQITYSDFDSASGEMVEEVLTIHYSDLIEGWPLLEG